MFGGPQGQQVEAGVERFGQVEEVSMVRREGWKGKGNGILECLGSCRPRWGPR